MSVFKKEISPEVTLCNAYVCGTPWCFVLADHKPIPDAVDAILAAVPACYTGGLPVYPSDTVVDDPLFWTHAKNAPLQFIDTGPSTCPSAEVDTPLDFDRWDIQLGDTTYTIVTICGKLMSTI